MHYVYILRSINHPKRLYIGCAQDIDKRLIEHNRGTSTYSKTYAPWELESYVSFKDRAAAEDFEHYLKSGSGHAFLKKRLLPKLSLAAAKLLRSAKRVGERSRAAPATRS